MGFMQAGEGSGLPGTRRMKKSQREVFSKAQDKLYLPCYQMKPYNQEKQVKAEGGTSLVEMRSRSL